MTQQTTLTTGLWPHQQKAISQLRSALCAGHRCVILYAPTGAGKTRIIREVAASACAKGKRTGILTHRRILIDQTAGTMEGGAVPYGVVAAGHQLDHLSPVQIISRDTLRSRLHSNRLELPSLDVLLVDEAHSQCNGFGGEVIQQWLDSGTIVVLVTATPVGLGHLATEIVSAGSYSELIDSGVLVPCKVYAPSEPDMHGVSKSGVEYTYRGMSRRLLETQIYGDIYEHWLKLNTGQPTVVFAPGVRESKWIADEIFHANGVTAEHVDGETPASERNAIFARVAAGLTQVVTSCGVLREGWDLPQVGHGILLQVCGGLSTYLQIAGRLLRAAPGKTEAVLQDHAGAWWRHGPPDMDRYWSLGDDDAKIATQRKTALQSGKESEGVCCPKCGFVRPRGPACPSCGHQHTLSIRRVREVGGALTKMRGPVTKRKRVKTPDELWRQQLIAGSMVGRTIKQAMGTYYYRNGTRPPESVLPPVSERHKLVTEVYPWTMKIANRRSRRGI